MSSPVSPSLTWDRSVSSPRRTRGTRKSRNGRWNPGGLVYIHRRRRANIEGAHGHVAAGSTGRDGAPVGPRQTGRRDAASGRQTIYERRPRGFIYHVIAVTRASSPLAPLLLCRAVLISFCSLYSRTITLASLVVPEHVSSSGLPSTYTVCPKNKANYFLAQRHQTAAKRSNFWQSSLRNHCDSGYVLRLTCVMPIPDKMF